MTSKLTKFGHSRFVPADLDVYGEDGGQDENVEGRRKKYMNGGADNKAFEEIAL